MAVRVEVLFQYPLCPLPDFNNNLPPLTGDCYPCNATIFSLCAGSHDTPNQVTSVHWQEIELRAKVWGLFARSRKEEGFLSLLLQKKKKSAAVTEQAA